jgi:hypothetical protein
MSQYIQKAFVLSVNIESDMILFKVLIVFDNLTNITSV